MGREARGLTDAFEPELLEQLDWTREVQPPNHPVALIVKTQRLYNKVTGELVATLEPGYRFYWAHQHVHIAPFDWDGKDAFNQMAVRTQVAKPLSPP